MDNTTEQIISHFCINENGTFNVADLCRLDNTSINTCIKNGYSLNDIHKALIKLFNIDRSKERLAGIKKFIEAFDEKK